MLTAYERHLLAVWLSNAASSLHHRNEEAPALATWVAERENRTVFASTRKRRHRRRLALDADEGMSARRLRHLQEALEDERSKTKARCDRTGRRLRCLAKTTGLNRTDVGILELLLRYQTQPIIESMVDDVFGRTGRNINALNLRGRALSALLGVSVGTVHRRFANGAPLVRSGLVSIDNDGDLIVVSRLHRIATVPGETSVDVHRLLLPSAPASGLEWSDFDHIARDRDHVERLLAGALDAGAPGVNILLHGPPGTGKTELCKVLADRLGVTLFAVGETDDDGDEPARGERLQELRLAQRLLAEDRGSLLLFDEMEDLLSDPFPALAFFGRSSRSRSRESSSKVFMHRLLEQAPAPTLWTMNDAAGVSRAILRRMMFTLELRPPTARVRARIWTRQLERHGIEAQPHEAQALASEFEATPGVAAGATAAARLGGGGIETVRRGVRSLSRVLSCAQPPEGTPARFDLALVHADFDPRVLADRLARSGKRRFSLCLQGPPGTGKSALVRYLAERLGLEVVQKRASDLMSMWVGETEQRIAAAFAQARDSNAFLVFDEADSLFADRRFARRSWEVSQVNEMLTWMESHPLPFACTTNFGEHLDPATLRWCAGRRRFSIGCTSRKRSPRCCATSATPSRIDPGQSGFDRRRIAADIVRRGSRMNARHRDVEDSGMRYERLQDIVRLAVRLQGTLGGLTLDDIGAEFSVSRRTAERLRDAVEAVFGALEIVDTADTRRHWRLQSDALRRLVHLSAEELAQVEAAVQVLERAGLEDNACVLRGLGTKLRVMLRPDSLARIESDLETLVHAEGLAMRPGPRPRLDPGLLALVREAISASRVMEFRYVAQSTRRRSRQRVEPYGLLYGNRTFLVARTDWAEEPRLWRLANVSEARMTGEAFERDPEFDLQRYARRSFGTFQERPVDVVLRFDAGAASDAAAFLFHPDQVIDEHLDGSLTVRFTAGGIDEMCWHLFTWGESVTIEKPARLRRRMAEMCGGVGAHHRGGER